MQFKVQRFGVVNEGLNAGRLNFLKSDCVHAVVSDSLDCVEFRFPFLLPSHKIFAARRFFGEVIDIPTDDAEFEAAFLLAWLDDGDRRSVTSQVEIAEDAMHVGHGAFMLANAILTEVSFADASSDGGALTAVRAMLRFTMVRETLKAKQFETDGAVLALGVDAKAAAPAFPASAEMIADAMAAEVAITKTAQG